MYVCNQIVFKHDLNRAYIHTSNLILSSTYLVCVAAIRRYFVPGIIKQMEQSKVELRVSKLKKSTNNLVPL